MKAVRIHTYGGSDVLQLEDVAIPAIASDEVLVKIHASSINPLDWKVREGYLKDMNLHHLPLTLGWDFSGEIVKIGHSVSLFRVGDAVYCRPALENDGTYAEYIAVKASEVALKPVTISHLQAASIPLAGITAWETLITTAGIKPGQRVLIHAASGGVGSLAVQLAKAKGCYVIGTTSTTNVELVKSLGADEVIDYKTTDFTQAVSDVDVVLDTLGGKVQEESYKVLKKGGLLVSIAGYPNKETAEKYGVNVAFVFISPNAPVLKELRFLIDLGKIKPVIDRVFSLSEIKKAHEYSQTGRSRGKIVIDICDN